MPPELIAVLCVLHVCGGDPLTSHKIPKMVGCSPRMWRWSSSINLSNSGIQVFSTYVEVILSMYHETIQARSVLHVCGGDPVKLRSFLSSRKCSPRMWRWSLHFQEQVFRSQVFSTYVEVILFEPYLQLINQCVLHVCGGDPGGSKMINRVVLCSPRMWRWSSLSN